jgi:hypothetical protein
MFRYYVSFVTVGDEFFGSIYECDARIESEEDVAKMVQHLQEKFDTDAVVPISWNYLGVAK